jgi:hypothetical protein
MIRKFYDVYYDGGGNGGDYVVDTELKEASTIIECECGSHILKAKSEAIIYHNKDGSKQVKQEFKLSFFNHGKEKKIFFDRIIIAFKYLFSGKMFDDQLILSKEEAVNLSQFILGNSLTAESFIQAESNYPTTVDEIDSINEVTPDPPPVMPDWFPKGSPVSTTKAIPLPRNWKDSTLLKGAKKKASPNKRGRPKELENKKVSKKVSKKVKKLKASDIRLIKEMELVQKTFNAKNLISITLIKEKCSFSDYYSRKVFYALKRKGLIDNNKPSKTTLNFKRSIQ